MSQRFPDIVTILQGEFDWVPRDVIERCVATEAQRYRDATVTAFVAIFVERGARELVSSLRQPGDWFGSSRRASHGQSSESHQTGV